MTHGSTIEPMPEHGCATDSWAVDKQQIEIIPLPALMEMTPPEVRSLVEKVHLQKDVATTYMQMYYVFLLSQQYEAALDMQTRALRLRRVFRIRGKSEPLLRLLVVMGPGIMLDNTPIEFVLHGCQIETSILYLLPSDDVVGNLPKHDITFVAIGESSTNLPLLEKMQAMMKDWPTPVVNQPVFIKNCARDKCYQLLQGIPGIYMPATMKVHQGELIKNDFPITIRPIDTQGGEGLEKIEDAVALARYCASYPAQEYYVAKFLNYQSHDGHYRKMRIVMIDGKPVVSQRFSEENKLLRLETRI